MLYIIAIMTILSVLVTITGVTMSVVCFIYCKNKRFRKTLVSCPHSHSPPSFMDQEPVINKTPLSIELLTILWKGKFTETWKGKYHDRSVAVKFVQQRHFELWQNEKSLYTMESTAHENILRFIDSEERGTGYNMELIIITEYHSLGSLNQFLLRNTITWPQALNIIHSVSSGLAHLHSSIYVNSDGFAVEKYAIAHRDVKSANVLVKNDSGECVLGDLGLSLILDPATDDRHLASSGQVGTYRYMAPEALDARVNLRDIESFKQTDVYALALIMWEVCTRCKIDDGPVQTYQLPFVDIVGERPTLELMKEAVVIKKNRPHIMDYWKFHQGLRLVSEMMFESWDEDPEARLTAANIVSRLDIMSQEKQSKDKLTDEVENSSQAVVSPVLEASSSSIHKKVRISSSFSGQSNSHPVSPDVRLSVGNSEFPRSLLNVFQTQIRRVNFNHPENIELTNFQQLPTEDVPFQNLIPPHPHSSTQDAAVSRSRSPLQYLHI